jgi:quercetin dioxygenase-like cupin family protein
MSFVHAEHAGGKAVDLGVVKMRLLASRGQTNGTLGVAEFSGAEGMWTVPHVHRRMEESFYVLSGRFAFTVGDTEVEATAGGFLMVPRGVRHVIRCCADGGTLLALFTPAGLEEMFLELGSLSPDSITNPDVRAGIASRHDSIPA